MGQEWFVIGISGATCGGKTTIANKLNNIFPRCRVIRQDDYFLPVDDERHVWIPELNHINFDILTSLDMNQMYHDIREIIGDSECKVNLPNREVDQDHSSINSIPLTDLELNVVKKLKDSNLNILIIEGFCIFYHKHIESLCNLKCFVTLSKEECYKRRLERVYEPPDVPGYFEHCVWPEYLRQFEDVKNSVKNVHYISEYTEDPVKVILHDLLASLNDVSD